MRPVLCSVLLVVLWLTFARAQSRFDGTWKIDLRCTICDPPLDIKADDRDQKITLGGLRDDRSLVAERAERPQIDGGSVSTADLSSNREPPASEPPPGLERLIGDSVKFEL